MEPFERQAVALGRRMPGTFIAEQRLQGGEASGSIKADSVSNSAPLWGIVGLNQTGSLWLENVGL